MQTKNINIAQVVTNNVPPLVGQEIYMRGALASYLGLTPDVVVTFGDSGLTVARSELYSAVKRAFLDPVGVTYFTDRSEASWSLKVQNYEDGFCVASHEDKLVPLHNVWMFLPQKDQRQSAFARLAKESNIPVATIDSINMDLENPVNDHQADVIQGILNEAPVHYFKEIETELGLKSIRYSVLVPPKRNYYDILVGPYLDTYSLKDHLDKTVPAHLDSLHNWDPVEGFRFSLWTCSHAMISRKLKTQEIEESRLGYIFQRLATSGDVLSQLAAVEIGLINITRFPSLRPHIIAMINRIRNDDPKDEHSAFFTLAALITFVDGELARLGIFASTPPYYRRRAAIAQASMLQQIYSTFSGSDPKFIDSMHSSRFAHFFSQMISDLRLEPRTLPSEFRSKALKMYFLQRLKRLGEELESSDIDAEVRTLLADFTSGDLLTYDPFPLRKNYEPLEASLQFVDNMTEDLELQILHSIQSDEISWSSLQDLLMSTSWYGATEKIAQACIDLLRDTQYHVKVDSPISPTAVHCALAGIAAESRSPKLAEELVIFARRIYKNTENQDAVSLNIFQNLLFAAGAYEDFKEWCQFVGRVIHEISLFDISKETATIIHNFLKTLLAIHPELWATCSGAERALATMAR